MAKELREYRIDLTRGRVEWKPDEDRLGRRSKLGGQPDWEQGDETPVCPDCGQDMSFVAQIDSVEHDSDENPNRVDCLDPEQEYMFGDVGLIYLFFCKGCLQPAAVFQCG